MSYGEWPGHWPAALSATERRTRAARALDKLHRQGLELEPVLLEGRSIARTHWGRAWCDNLESYSDYSNRLPRGRSYVRSGAVCHLEIQRGRIRARVCGARLYEVTINVRPLPAASWSRIMERCIGRICSALELLQASLPAEVLRIVTDREAGLFPAPREIQMRCTCPDRAFMCKHIAAALYGVGARLDASPELLFLLRGVDPAELAEAKNQAVVQAVLRGGQRPRLSESDIAEVFGLDLDPPQLRQAGPSRPAAPESYGGKPPDAFTAADIRGLRERLGFSRKEFARHLGVSQATLSSWERAARPPRLQARTRSALQRAWRRCRRGRAKRGAGLSGSAG